MEQLSLYTQASSWWLLACVLLAGTYAGLLYWQEKYYGNFWRWALASIRFVVVLGISLFLLRPVLRSTTTQTDPPRVAIAIDNSESMKLAPGADKLNGHLASLKTALEDKGLAVELLTSNKAKGALNSTASVDSLRYDQPFTNLSELMGGVREAYENRHLNAVVLLTDGLFNQGLNPTYLPSRVPIYTLGHGDTVPKRDVAIRGVACNRIAYLGNSFPVSVQLYQHGYNAQQVKVSVSGADGVELTSRLVQLHKSGGLVEATLLVKADKPGQQQYTVTASPLDGEFSTRNNSRSTYVEVVDGRERVLIVAAAPHPDIKAIKAALELESNMEVDIWLPTFGPASVLKPGKPDLIILHQLPDAMGTAREQLNKWKAEKVPAWFIIGPMTDLVQLDGWQPAIQVNAKGGQWDKVNARVNAAFAGFNLADGSASLLPKLPPLEVPFGKPALANGGVALLQQALGNVELGLPLLAINSEAGKRGAVLMGAGLWQWRLQEFAETGKHNITDGLIRKVVQYLSAKDDKRKFRVYPVADAFFQGDAVYLQAELYNDLYEPVSGADVQLSLTKAGKPAGNFSFATAEGATRMALGTLLPGVYNFRANASVNGQAQSATGQFTVQAYDLEATQTTADMALLRNMASQSGGVFALAPDWQRVVDHLVKAAPKAQLRSYEDLSDAINLRWLLFLLASMAVLEWFIRKLKGGF